MGGCLPCLRSSNIQANVARASTHSGLRFTSAVTSPSHIHEATDRNDAPIPRPQTMAAKSFTFQELATATNSFRPESRIGEGGFGHVYKGHLESTGEVVAVKQLNIDGIQGNQEFTMEIGMLSKLRHENLVKLIGYCAEGDQRIVVYEFMPLGSLYDHLHDKKGDKNPLDWHTRLKIATGAAKGLEYLHDKANPAVIIRDFKTANVLLNEGYEPKISDFGLAKFGPVGDKTHVTTRVMGTLGYCAPDYAMTGQLTVKSDVYSFGVVLLEIITGREAIDNTRKAEDRNLVEWAKPLFRDRRKFPKMVDPTLRGRYPTRGLYQLLAIAAMCLQDDAASRPSMGDVATSLIYVASQVFDPNDVKENAGRELLVASSELKNIDWQDLRKQFRERWVIHSESDKEQSDEGEPSDRKMKHESDEGEPSDRKMKHKSDEGEPSDRKMKQQVASP